MGKVLDKEFAIADLDGNSQLSAIEIRNWYKQKYPSFRVAETMTGIRENISSAGRGEVAAEPTSTVQILFLHVLYSFFSFVVVFVVVVVVHEG